MVRLTLYLSPLLATLLAGCDLLEAIENPTVDGWQVLGAHPCMEYRVDALLVEDDGETIWLGCGAGALGFGLFRSVDAGRTWGTPRTEPADYFDTFRVNAIVRASDGALYVGGAQNPGSDMVVVLDDSGSPATVTPLLARGATFDRSFQVGSFQIKADGTALAESLTGHGMLLRQGAGGTFEPVEGWANDGGSYQVLNTALFEDQIYGSGSTIADTFRLFLPPAVPDPERFTRDVVSFEGTRGELWGVAVDAGGLAAAGVEQTTNHAVVVTGPTTGRDPSDFTVHDLRPALRQGDPSRLYGICRRGDTILAIGDYSRRSHGLALRSTDGGQRFSEITTGAERGGEPSPILDRCAILPDGTAIVAGGMGFIARYRR